MIPNPCPGIFIVFDGIDGCGKTEQQKKLIEWLKTRGKTVMGTKEPGKDRFWGKRIYEELMKPRGLHVINPLGFQAWYACDSKEHMREVVIPRLRAGCNIVSDRYRSSMVYGAASFNDIKELMLMNQMILGEDFIWPDIILILDLTPETAIERLKKQGKLLDEHEQHQILERVRRNYRDFSLRYPRCKLIDAEGPPEEVFEEVKKIILPVIESKFGPVA